MFSFSLSPCSTNDIIVILNQMHGFSSASMKSACKCSIICYIFEETRGQHKVCMAVLVWHYLDHCLLLSNDIKYVDVTLNGINPIDFESQF